MNTSSFEELNLNKDLIRGVYLYGFKDPSQIQINGIKSISTSRDCIIQSQSGTGKTATYLLAVLNKIHNNNMLQGIIVAPTRELASQIYNVCTELSKFTNIKLALCVGGSNLNNNRVELYNINLIIGTVGRIWYLITSKIININTSVRA
jgi:superfamily II DNA/RNA helicase